MNRSMLKLGMSLLAILLTASVAQAQATRTWVSGVGDDVNPCSRTAPCKTFAGAISKTAAGGEISVLDPGGFGGVTITKSITINGDGTLAGILNSLTTGITINAAADSEIVLRNLSINGAGTTSTGLSGIRFLAGKSLVVDNVTINGFSNFGIEVALGATNSNVHIKDTTITNTPNATGGTGIRIATSVGFVLASLDNVNISGGLNNGIDVSTNGRAMISNSVISGMASNGILASAATAVINAEGNQVAFNAIAGINASVSGSVIRIANNEIYNNTSGITIAAGATVNSAGNNRVAGNSASTAPNGAAITLQ